MEATIELMDLQDATVVARFTSDPTTGEYMIVVPAGRDYAMHVKADGYLLHSEYIHVPAGQRGLDLAVDIGMEPLSNGSRMELRNVFFPMGSAELQPTSMAELDQVLQMLQQNADLRLEVSGHTDNAGPPEVNQRLSEARANSVRDHLVGKGIDASRLTAIGHGDALPVVPNDSDAERARNRRTEIKVL
jgi:outer membrane protein OmpA-like peptidoglycan-associated protein